MASHPHPTEALEERLVDFAARIIKVAAALSRVRGARHISDQLARCGTSPAANHAEARAAESRADYARKISIVAKELRETSVWLKIAERSGLIPAHRVAGLLDENEQLIRIFGATLNSLRKGSRK